MALKFDLAIRKYVANNIRPLMYELVGEDEFVPETMSTSYVARTIFEDVRSEFPDYIIKFSSDNPRNPANQAGPEELKVIEYLNNNSHLKKWEGIISINDKQYMSKFSARRMTESCLRCHGDPKDAPASLIEKYGSTAGFHRPIGEIIGLDTRRNSNDQDQPKIVVAINQHFCIQCDRASSLFAIDYPCI